MYIKYKCIASSYAPPVKYSQVYITQKRFVNIYICFLMIHSITVEVATE